MLGVRSVDSKSASRQYKALSRPVRILVPVGLLAFVVGVIADLADALR